MEDIKARGMIPCAAAIALSLLTACGQNGTTSQDGDDQKLGTPVPSAISTSNLPDNSLLRVFLDVNGERSPMTINGSAAETTVANLPAGASTVAIVFEYQSRNFGDVVLATATQMLTLQPGQNSLAFNEQDYQFPDDDGDGATNLAEIRKNTDPGDPTDWRPRQWGTMGRISNALTGSARVPSLAVDPSGNGLVVWSQFDGETNSVWANRFAPDSGWGNAERLGFSETVVTYLKVGMDANGNGIVVLRQGDSLLASRFDPAASWGAPVRLNLVEIPVRPDLAMSASGVATVVWSERDEPMGMISSIRARRFDGTSWGDSTLIDNSSLEAARNPKVALDVNGNALVIWLQGGHLWANRFVADTGWGTATQLERLGGIDSEFHPFNIAMDSNGNGMAVWVEIVDDTRAIFRASHFDATTGIWRDATLLVSPSVAQYTNNQPPTVAFDAAGNALAIWRQNSGEGFNSIWANRFDAATTTWGSATLIEDIDTPVFLPEDGSLAVRANGEAWAVWGQTGGMLFANRFDPLAQAWGTPVLVGNNSFVGTAKIAFADDGRGLAVWAGAQRQTGSPNTFAIFSNRLQ